MNALNYFTRRNNSISTIKNTCRTSKYATWKRWLTLGRSGLHTWLIRKQRSSNLPAAPVILIHKSACDVEKHHLKLMRRDIIIHGTRVLRHIYKYIYIHIFWNRYASRARCKFNVDLIVEFRTTIGPCV